MNEDRSEWTMLFVVHEVMFRIRWSTQRNLPCEKNLEPRVSCNLYHISSQESTLFLIRKIPGPHFYIYCFSQFSAQQLTWSPHLCGQASSPVFFLSWQPCDSEAEIKQTFGKCDSSQKWRPVSPGLHVWPHGQL